MKYWCLIISFFFTVQVSAQEAEPDILEPNNTPEQAVSIDVFTAYWVSLYPEGDQDLFSFTLSKSMSVQPQASGTEQSVYWEILDEKGHSLGSRFPLILAAGRYYAKLTGVTSAQEFMVIIKAVPEQVLQKVPAFPEQGKTYVISLSQPGATDSFSVTPEHDGYLTLQSFQLPEGQVQFSCSREGKAYRGNPLVIPVKKGDKIAAALEATHQYSTGTPFTLYIAGSELLDDTEVNDSIPLATGIDKSKPVFFSLYPAGDTDCFEVTLTDPGKIYASLSYAFNSGGMGNRFPYAIDLYDEKRLHVGTFGYRFTGAGYVYGSTYLKDPGTYYMVVQSNHPFEDEQLLRMQLFGNVSGRSNEAAFNDIYFIGFELDTSANMALQALAESQGAHVSQVDSTGSIEETLSSIFEDAKRKGGKKNWLWWLLGIGLAGGTGYWVYRKKIKGRA